MKIRYAGSTHVGMKRPHNEDNFFLLAEENLYMVADGMGGHASGEVASQIAVESVANFFIDTSRDSDVTWPYKEDKACSYNENRLTNGIKLANRRIFETAKSDSRYRGMGTTIVSLMASKDGAMLAHVGDSRVYRIRESKIEQLTEDHSLLNDYLKVHKLTPEEIKAFPHKNVIVRALGMKETVIVDVKHIDPKEGDKFILCSDGLSGMITDDNILETVQSAGNQLEKACQDLIQRANEAGGHDNITVVLVHFSN
jgi:serine/threonine protein phosphatase PrpC